jgi:Domain of unknown function (DUF1707)/Cell wall-active antibiotics response 4TMS YvqF
MSGEPPDILASDQDRDRVAVLLREHCVAGRLTLEEFSERTDRALAARTSAELEDLTGDLDPAATAAPPPALGAHTFVRIIGGLNRGGRWRVPTRTRVIGLIGGADIDLTDAVIESSETVLEAWWLIGGINLTVPEGIEVEVGGATVIGGVDNEARAVSARAPRVVVRQFGLIGGTNVEVRSR